MSDQKYDSVLVGWADEPKFNDNNELMSWQLRLKDHELKDMLDQYVTSRNEQGQGGNPVPLLHESGGIRKFLRFLLLLLELGGKWFLLALDSTARSNHFEFVIIII